jgi:glucosamine kinase
VAGTTSDTRDGLVLGGDVGGTSTRILVADLTGRVVGRGRGSPVAHPETAHRAFADALAEALVEADPARVVAGVVGMAGSGAVRDPAVRAGYEQVWSSAGLTGTPDVRSDLEVAFAAGTEATEGSVLIAGTGAVSGRLRDGRLVAAVGGHGWLLGDEGSGFWLGREAVRATLRALEGVGPASPLTDSVLDALEVTAGPQARALVVGAAYARPPVQLSALAPLVSRAHAAGDPAATALLDDAAAHLLATWDGLGPGRADGPVVLAGSLLAAGTYLGAAVRAGLTGRGGLPCSGDDPVEGAVRLALRGVHA